MGVPFPVKPVKVEAALRRALGESDKPDAGDP